MSKLRQFNISLSQPSAVYHAGEKVIGHVTIDLTEALTMRGIWLQFDGEANVHWSEPQPGPRGKGSNGVTRHYRATETYFHRTNVLFGNAHDQFGDDVVCHAGRHTYPFQFQLPKNLPSSFEGAYGCVRYSVKATIDRPRKTDHHFTVPLTVLSVLDLNTQQNMLSIQQARHQKRLCCWVCESGPVSASLQTNRRGYVPGEHITCRGEVNNETNRRMKSSRVELRMTVTYRATKKTRSVTNTIVAIRKNEIAARDTELWMDEKIRVPPLPPSELAHCQIIDVRYQVALVVEPSGFASDLEVVLPVVVGTVPLRSAHSETRRRSRRSSGGATAAPRHNSAGDGALPMGERRHRSHPAGLTRPHSIPPTNPTGTSTNRPNASANRLQNAPHHHHQNIPPGDDYILPPSYEECVFGKVNLELPSTSDANSMVAIDNNVNYAPRYQVFNDDVRQSADFTDLADIDSGLSQQAIVNDDTSQRVVNASNANASIAISDSLLRAAHVNSDQLSVRELQLENQVNLVPDNH